MGDYDLHLFDLHLFHAGHDRVEAPPESLVLFVSGCAVGRVALTLLEALRWEIVELMTIRSVVEIDFADFEGCGLSDEGHIVLKRFEGMAPSKRKHPCATKRTP